jgi:adenine-specific DNA-methyltransferase
LKLARNLLSDDGVIFISIDDSEQSRLMAICSEILGEYNYCGTFVWKRRSGATDSINNISTDHEYVLAFGKSEIKFRGLNRTFDGYENKDGDPRGPWKADNLSAGKPGGDVYYPIFDPATNNEFYPPEGRFWPYSRITMANKILEKRIIFPKLATGRPMLKRFSLEAKSDVLPVSTWLVSKEKDMISNSLYAPLNTNATREVQGLFEKKLFPHPKSTQLIKSLMGQCLKHDEVVVDFFSGSATTAHAVMQLNSEDGGNRKFIMVQLPEACDEKSEAFKADYKTIAEISKERIRRAGSKILEGECHENWNKDVGFRVLKVDDSNMADTYYTPDEINQDMFAGLIDNVKFGRAEPMDLLFQVLLESDAGLTSPIQQKTIQNKTVFIVNHAPYDLIACFDKGIDEALVKELAALEPMRLVFRNIGFDNDDDMNNAEQLLRQLSPHTEMKVI